MCSFITYLYSYVVFSSEIVFFFIYIVNRSCTWTDKIQIKFKTGNSIPLSATVSFIGTEYFMMCGAVPESEPTSVRISLAESCCAVQSQQNESRVRMMTHMGRKTFHGADTGLVALKVEVIPCRGVECVEVSVCSLFLVRSRKDE